MGINIWSTLPSQLRLSVEWKKVLFTLCGLVCFFPFVNSQLALIIGIVFRLIVGNVEIKFLSKLCKWLLQVAVIILGLRIDVQQAMNTGQENFIYVGLSVLMILVFGILFSRVIKLSKNVSMLISSGTAICGGSAVASLAPILRASNSEISVSLTVIFILNALAVLIFPGLGTVFNMSQTQFGLWCAIAIHDTSSVVGAAAVYGQEALEVATTTKLTRMLWIIPIMLLLSTLQKSGAKLKFPWFILMFILALILTSFFPLSEVTQEAVLNLSKAFMAGVLFLIGSTLGLNKATGAKPMLFGTALWVVIVIVSGCVIIHYC